MPAWLKINIHNDVDDAAAVGLDLERVVADLHIHLRVFHWNANEVAPAACAGGYLVATLWRLRQQHASKHPNRARRPIARIGNYLSDFPGITSTSRPPALQRLVDSCGPVYDGLLHRFDPIGPRSRTYSPPLRRSTSLRRSAAAITAGACSRPGCRDSRSIGPDTLTAAMTLPDGERTGAETEATPGSRSPTEWAQPRRRTAARATAEKRLPRSPRCIRSGSSHANSTCAADPALMVSWVPTGTLSRKPDIRSAVATHTR